MVVHGDIQTQHTIPPCGRQHYLSHHYYHHMVYKQVGLIGFFTIYFRQRNIPSAGRVVQVIVYG